MAKKSGHFPEQRVSSLNDDKSAENNQAKSPSTSPKIGLRRADSYRSLKRAKKVNGSQDAPEKRTVRRRNLRSRSTPNIPPHLFSQASRSDGRAGSQDMSKEIDPLEERKKSLGALLGFSSLDHLRDHSGENGARAKPLLQRSLSSVDRVRHPGRSDHVNRDVKKAASFNCTTKDSSRANQLSNLRSHVSAEEILNGTETPLFQATTIFIPGYDFNKNRLEKLKETAIDAEVEKELPERRGSLPKGYKWRSKAVELKREEKRKESSDLSVSSGSPSTRLLRKLTPASSQTRMQGKDAAKPEPTAVSKKNTLPRSRSSELEAPTQGRVRTAVAHILGLNADKYDINPTVPKEKPTQSTRHRRYRDRHLTAPTITFTPEETCRSSLKEELESSTVVKLTPRLATLACNDEPVLKLKNPSEEMFANLSKSFHSASIAVSSPLRGIASTDLCVTDL